MRQGRLGQGQGGPSFKRVINYLCELGGGGEAEQEGGAPCTVCERVKCTQTGPGQGKLFGKDLAKAGPSQGRERGRRVERERPGMWPGAGARVVWGEI